MKKVIQYIVVLLITTSYTSCLDLDIGQDSKIDASSMWKTEEDCKSAMYGMYGQMRVAFSTNYASWGDYRAGMFKSSLALGADISYMCSNTITSSNSGANWASLYKLINMANLVIKYTQNMPFSKEAEKNWVLANAYYVRAFSYYYVARNWGDAPLLVDGFESENDPGLYPAKTAATEIYRQVENDIKEAVLLMPAALPAGTSAKSTATAAAVNMLKADYYLWMAKTQRIEVSIAYPAAQEGLDQVFADKSLALLDTYADLFDATKKKGNTETIFVIHFAKDEYEGGFAKNYLFTDGTVNAQDKDLIADGTIAIGTEGGIAQRVTFETSFEKLLYAVTSDQRAQATYRVEKTAAKTYKWINKYAGEWISDARYYSSDIIVYRLADAILFQAELYGATGKPDKAIDELNKIAERAYGVKNYYSSDTEDVDEMILEERMKEFAAEGKLWWDFIRMGVVFERVPSLAGREDEKDVLLWPIHNDAKNKNPNL